VVQADIAAEVRFPLTRARRAGMAAYRTGEERDTQRRERCSTGEGAASCFQRGSKRSSGSVIVPAKGRLLVFKVDRNGRQSSVIVPAKGRLLAFNTERNGRQGSVIVPAKGAGSFRLACTCCQACQVSSAMRWAWKKVSTAWRPRWPSSWQYCG